MARSRALIAAWVLDCPERATYAPSSIRLSGSGSPGPLFFAGFCEVAVEVVEVAEVAEVAVGVAGPPAPVVLPPLCPVLAQATAESSATSSASSQAPRLMTSPRAAVLGWRAWR